MANSKKRSRHIIAIVAALLIAAAVTVAFWPRPTLVDFGEVTRGPMMVTIDEEGRTQVREPYVVATPFAGRLQRVEAHPGDAVTRGDPIAYMLPTNPAALDIRTLEQARAAVAAANASLNVARADLDAAIANRDLATSELDRTTSLHDRNIASDAALERAEQSARVAESNVDVATAAVAVQEANLKNAQAQLTGFTDPSAPDQPDEEVSPIPLRAPADGLILRVIQENETTLPAGAPVMEIGDITSDLEVVVSLISSDAVQVRVGDRVIIDGWGGPSVLSGEVTRIDPFGTTKVSALGVEEQRVPLVVSLTSPSSDFEGLGHGFRVEAQIVVWENDDALKVPTSALFRDGGGWAAFTEKDGKAAQVAVEIGRDNGFEAEVLGGLAEGDPVILYPSASVSDGTAVASRLLE